MAGNKGPEKTHKAEVQTGNKDTVKATPAAKEAVKKNTEIQRSKAELLKAVDSRKETSEKWKKRMGILKGNMRLTETEVDPKKLQTEIDAVSKEKGNEGMNKQDLKQKALKNLSSRMSDEDRINLVDKRISGYDKVGEYKVKGPDGKEYTVNETQFEHLQKEKPGIKKLSEQISPDLTKELLSVYGETQVDGYAKELAEKGVTSLEEAEKVIYEEGLKRKATDPKNQFLLDENGKELSGEKRQEVIDKMMDYYKKHPEVARDVARRMASQKGISQAEAHNVQPVKLDLHGNAKDRTLGLIKHFEGYSKKSFWDYKQWTRGYGTKAKGPGQTISEADASKELEDKIASQYNIQKLIPNIYDKLGDNQKAALTSFIFNLGPGKMSSLKPLLKSYVDNPNQATAKAVGDKMMKFVHAGGKILKGLVQRRKTEAKLFIEGGKENDSKDNSSTETPKKAA